MPPPRWRITTPSKAWRRSFSPSMTLTETFTVSPGPKPLRSFLSCPASTILMASMTAPLLVSFGGLCDEVRGPATLAEPVHPFLLFRREVGRLQEIGPAPPCPPHRHDPPPLRDAAVVAREQRRRHAEPAPDLWAGVLGMLQEPRGSARERVVLRRIVLAEDAGPEPRDRVGNHQRGQLAPGEDVVADRQLLVDDALAEALVHALVAPAHQDQMRPRRQLPRHRLREPPPRRVEQDHSRIRRADRLDARGQRLRLQDHAAAAAEWRVVGHLMAAGGVLARVPQPDVDEPARLRAGQDRLAQGALEHPGKQRDDVDLHGRLITARAVLPEDRSP